ncbi:fumarylacetoacetate hydrolase family protein [Pseudonocardia acaciae]|uniref:fumarylacetoacetate hydrolase family protein n=1 Tax=Pseudonocardia acaciae TaxID=551276 RepID=UPI00048D70D5|nr:fumarylacetoacetate hydrolase family protein [Pseudonocardia acaciae]
MKLLTFRGRGGAAVPGALLPCGLVVDLAAAPLPDQPNPERIVDVLALDERRTKELRACLDRWDAAPAEGLDRGWLTSGADLRLLPPTGANPLFISSGGLYLSHLAEMGARPPDRPGGYLVNPNTLIGSGQPIVLPPAVADMVDWEGELCLVFGRDAHALDPESALSHIAGYTLFNDISARHWVPGTASSEPREAVAAWNWIVLHKSFPTFGPLGPWIVTRDELPEIEERYLTTTLNGAVMQHDRVGNLARPISEIIALFTEIHPFKAGDILSLGTPAGVGYARSPQQFLQPGDEIAVTVDGLGTLTNPVARKIGEPS